jgi:hypothetical protein
MRSSRLFVGLLVMAALLPTTGCTLPRDWDPVRSPQELPPGKRLVIVALADTGPLHALYPAGRIELAEEVGREINFLCHDVEAQLGRNLVPAGSELWTTGGVPQAAGASMAILVRVLDLSYDRNVSTRGNPQNVYAVVQVQAVRPDGKVLWEKTSRGRAKNTPQPKQIGAGAKPESQAAYAALRYCTDYLREFIDRATSVILRPDPVPVDIQPQPNIPLLVDSTPRGADIFVDGLFRGTTPMEVPLPTRELTLRIQLVGYHVWETTLLPEAGMTIKPSLQSLPGTKEATPGTREAPPPPPELPPVPAAGNLPEVTE